MHVSASAGKYDVLQAVGELARLDPDKRLPDLWDIDEDLVLPLTDLYEIVESVARRLPSGSVGTKTGVVARDAFLRARIEMYAIEAQAIGLDMRIFHSREDALAWIHAPRGDPAAACSD